VDIVDNITYEIIIKTIEKFKVEELWWH
jgi:hypothetical protein